VGNNDTRLGYAWWCDHREEVAEDEGNDYCRTCGVLYGAYGDGYDGECPDCADKTEAKMRPLTKRQRGSSRKKA